MSQAAGLPQDQLRAWRPAMLTQVVQCSGYVSGLCEAEKVGDDEGEGFGKDYEPILWAWGFCSRGIQLELTGQFRVSEGRLKVGCFEGARSSPHSSRMPLNSRRHGQGGRRGAPAAQSNTVSAQCFSASLRCCTCCTATGAAFSTPCLSATEMLVSRG